ncbi:MAG: response regulator [Geobacteraceae bacterium]|nr:response regulator [Geobacteraceae bacterium]
MATSILIVDDFPEIRLILRDILTSEGYTVVAEAANGAEAVELYLKHRPDITITDINMPVKDGIEATGEILALDVSARIIFISSGQEYAELLAIARKAGAREAIPKPFTVDQVLEAVRRAVTE